MAGNDLFRRELEGVLEKYYALKEVRRRHPNVGDLVRALLPYPRGLRRTLAPLLAEEKTGWTQAALKILARPAVLHLTCNHMVAY